MSEEEQAAVFLKLRKEYRETQAEITGIREALLQQASKFTEVAEAVRVRMATIRLDKGLLISDTSKMCEQLDRYQDLLVKKADLQDRLKPFGDTFSLLA